MKKGQAGYSLVGVMMSVAIGSVLTYSLSQVFVSMAKTRARLEYTLERDQAFELIRLALNISGTCERNFVGKNIAATTDVPILYAKVGADGVSNRILYQQNTDPNFKGFRITKMTLLPGELMVDDSGYMSVFEVSYAKNSALDLNKVKKLNLFFQVDSGIITQCLNNLEE